MSWIQHSSASCCAYCPVRLSSANWGYFSLSTCGKQSHRSLTSFCIGNQSRHFSKPTGGTGRWAFVSQEDSARHRCCLKP